MRICVISPYYSKALNQLQYVIAKRIKNGFTIVEATEDMYGHNVTVVFDDGTVLERIQALPDDVESKIAEHYYDTVFIDSEYDDDEVRLIRNNLIGTQNKPVIIF